MYQRDISSCVCVSLAARDVGLVQCVRDLTAIMLLAAGVNELKSTLLLQQQIRTFLYRKPELNKK